MTVSLLDHTFVLPPDREASGPPESRGLARDEVRLLVSDRRSSTHAHFRELPRYLRPGDLVVVNNSATLSAAVDGRIGTTATVLHFATWLDDGSWVVEVRSTDGRPSDWSTLHPGMVIALPAGASATLIQPWLRSGRRLWAARLDGMGGSVIDWLQSHGRPISYSYVSQRWSASYYTTAFGRELGSAEMPSAGRPFTDRLITDLIAGGIDVAPITLHTGVSSPEIGEPPSPERFVVPESTARRVNAARSAGGRVVAIGTTVTRALETTATPDGRAHAGAGWTNLVLGPQRPTRVVDGLVTGWHAPGASHLQLLEAVVGADAVHAAYDAALAGGYLWHEFGDSALLLR
ncbi:S-adenosylmethionine:tRNA ribosyltransferase-isomerase [Antrihabitans cavernicola]|uniref:S-adenosylmethionine:tRNA ribosyltransferase-isomerase n=1 Tax=Antrihabitans cavernicola TaxID=2495913 RepID=A0A5A7SHX9_9NOCA|nr:S-adenosylmethionine:tRNA ribosyltransferase-isomerase [Spelaeibacter cavernicola]KAA0024203.1 S-adenosylmethionine:tRNA ribosyltransferase-isomerase [Spelaeibacter cavernicola]